MFEIVDTLLDLADLFGHGDLFGTDLRALPQRLTAPHSMFIVKERNPLIGCFIPRIEEVSEGPDESSRPYIGLRLFILIDGTRGCTACAENASDRLFKEALFLGGLCPLLFRRRCFCNQIGFDGTIPLKEGGKIYDEILNHFKHGKRFDQDFFLEISHQLLTGEATDPIDPHSIRSTDPVSAGPPEGQRGILFPPDSIQAVEKPIHGISLDFIGLMVRFLIFLGIKTKDFQLDEHPIPLSSAVL
jgi:hypothetical protein